MKELQRFREFLNEGVSPEALAKVFQDEILQAKANEEDDIVPAFEKGIEMLKQGVHPEKVNDAVQGMYIKITGDYSYDPAEIMIAAKEIDAGK